MTNEDIRATHLIDDPSAPIQIIRHADVREKLGISAAKLFAMIAQGVFPKPFVIVPGGRAVGWLERDVDAWIIERSNTFPEASE